MLLKNSPFTNALKAGQAKHDEIQHALENLVGLMKSVHGGDWLVKVDHERRCFFAYKR